VLVSLLIEEHRHYLADAARISAFTAAIASVVKPGDVVLDLASGTGVLGLLACRAGAARVYAIDSGGLAPPARVIARDNGYDARVRVIRGFSQHVDLPERADVLVTDQIGYFGFDAGIVELVADARRRLLKPDARLVPSRIDLLVAPVEAPDVTEAIAFWSGRPAGFNMESLREGAASSAYPRMLAVDNLLGRPACGGSIDLAGDRVAISLSAEVAISRPGTLDGVGGWFAAPLSPGHTLSNSPLAANRIDRRGMVFPVGRPTAVTAGDRVSVEMRILPAQMVMSWAVKVFRGGASEPSDHFAQSTLRGMLIDPEQLRRTRPDYVPGLTARGAARLSVLELCDGRRRLDAIEREVYDRHRALFSDPAAAAAFVADVVAGYSK